MSTKNTKTRKNKKYSFEEKREAVQRYFDGESVINIAKDLNMPDPDYMYTWIERYQIYGEVGLKRKRRKQPISNKDAHIKELEMENEILKKYLEILHKEGSSTSSK